MVLVEPILLTLAVMLLSGAGFYLVRRRVSLDVLRAHNEAVENYIVIIAALYGVLLAFVVLELWEQQRSAEENVSREAISLRVLYRLGAFLPGAAEVQEAARRYTESIPAKEWTLMLGRRAGHEERSHEMDRLWSVLMAIEPRTERERTVFAEAVSRLTALAEYRRVRLADSGKELAAYLWLALVVGGLFLVATTYFIGLENLKSQILLTAMSGGFIALVLFVVHDLQSSFHGNWRVNPEPYYSVLEMMKE
jgi:hypothetical protein